MAVDNHERMHGAPRLDVIVDRRQTVLVARSPAEPIPRFEQEVHEASDRAGHEHTFDRVEPARHGSEDTIAFNRALSWDGASLLGRPDLRVFARLRQRSDARRPALCEL